MGKSDDEYSVIGDKGDIGFIDFENFNSLCSYNPSEESQIVNISVPFLLLGKKPRVALVGKRLFDSITIKNTTGEPLDLWSVSIYDSKPEDSFTISIMKPPTVNSDEEYINDFVESFLLEDRVLGLDQALTIWLSCKPKEIGMHVVAVHFSVGDETIERMLFLMAVDTISQSLSSSKPYQRSRKKNQDVVKKHAPDAAYVVRRRPSKAHIRLMVNNQQIPDVITEGLTKTNYGSFFKTLLAMEEIKLEEYMRAYNMECVTMKSNQKQFLSLEVPGLAEKRPSLVNWDYIFVKLATEDEIANVAYQRISISDGPPGTGKIMTLIEAILQIYNNKRNVRILVCAPSNSAADHILEILISEKSANIQKNEIFRLNSCTHPFEDVNPNFIEFCCVEDSIFQCPSDSDLMQYRIIISTYTSAFLLYAKGIRRGHFSYFFLDEAGQASEPETMVPLSHLYSKDTVVVRPVVFSRDAESFGVGTSYLERLLDCELYKSGNEDYMMKLVWNYRNHEAILRLPKELLYQDKLIACKEQNRSFSRSWEDLLPDIEFPLLFIGIQGCDERERSNPSWFNRIEVSKVVEMIRLLIEEKGLKEDDIGVISPYRQQVCKIRGALEKNGKPNIKVGSVEHFQGQEREVIIISTVRSTIAHNEFDRVYNLGMFSNPMRFNVAITRARSLLVVIGNPHILCKTQTRTSSYGIVWTGAPIKVASYLKGRFSVWKVPKTLNAPRHGTCAVRWKMIFSHQIGNVIRKGIIGNLLKCNGVKRRTIGSLLKINGVAKVTGNLLKVHGFRKSIGLSHLVFLMVKPKNILCCLMYHGSELCRRACTNGILV
ncbi:putative RNA helicase SDE3 [Sesamum alatum]|uniref:RNA helicase n=1 Tax=Sesamum alatum TaxID=300844 RepID=A0AAE1YRP8_9LAMI|nr:putative RNA helicase SDE3 [Sesamum alatum]